MKNSAFILLMLVSIIADSQTTKQARTKAEIDRKLDSIIIRNTCELKKINDTIVIKNKNWEKINKSVKQKYIKK